MKGAVLAIVAIISLCSMDAMAGDWDNPNWTIEEVDSFGGLSSNTGLSAEVDSLGRPHVAYYALKGADLKHAVRTEEGWSTSTVDDYQVVGPDCSIALDGDDTPHICYYDKTNEELEYARLNGTKWEVETVDWLGIVGVGTAIAVDPVGVPYLAYIGARTLRCAVRTEEGWNVTVVDEGENHVYTPSMVIDHAGDPHILYLGSNNVKHAFLEDGSWTLEEVDSLRSVTVAMRTSIAVDPGGDLVACYANDAASSVIVAEREDGDWVKEKVTDGHFIGDLDMELDSDGEPRVAFLDMAYTLSGEMLNTDVWYMARSGSTWTKGVVMASSEASGVLLDLMVDGEGGPALALVDLDPLETRADLVHFHDWKGEFIEPYTGEPPGDDGPGDGPSGDDGGDPEIPGSMVALMVVALAVLVTILVVRYLRGAK